jgi:hypothetical protein
VNDKGCYHSQLWNGAKIRRRVLAVKRVFIALLVGLACAATAAAQDAQPQSRKPQATGNSCRSFVQKFYDWYVPMALDERVWRAWDVAVRRKPQAFTPELVTLIRRDTEAQQKATKATGELVELDFDPFLNSQDPSEKFRVKNVTRKNGGCLAEIRGLSGSEARETVVAEVLCKSGHCRFVNFHYPDHGTDLLGILKLSQ